jgi:hypothetical protein
MIPTVIILGILLGRWWRWSIPVLAAAWGVVVAVDVGPSSIFVGAALLGAANAIVGVLVYQLFAWPLTRWLARDRGVHPGAEMSERRWRD